MKVRLLTRWASYMPNDIVSVSDERAEYLEKEGIGRVINVPQPEAKVEEEPTEEVDAPAAPKPRGPGRK